MTRDDIQREARRLVGAPWVHQGRDPVAGIDCIGLLVFICNNLGKKVDDYTTYSREPDGETLIAEMSKYFEPIPLEKAREGDIIICRVPQVYLPRHIAIMAKGLNEYTLVHSINAKTGGMTVEEPLRRWMKYRTHSFRFPELEDK